MTQATFYDGINAERYSTEVELDGDTLRIAPHGDVALDELAIADDDKTHLVLTRRGSPGWRLILDQPVDPGLRARLPNAPRYGGWIDRFGLAKASVAFAVIAGAVLIVGHVAPRYVAPFVPP